MVLPDFGDSTESTAFSSKCGIRLCCETECAAAAKCAGGVPKTIFVARFSAKARGTSSCCFSAYRSTKRAPCLHREANTETLSSTHLCTKFLGLWLICRHAGQKGAAAPRHSRALVPYCSFRLPERRRAARTCAYSARVALVTVPENLSENDEAEFQVPNIKTNSCCGR